MSNPNTFTLDDIRAAADRKYSELVVPLDEHRSVTLVNMLRLPKERRAAIIKAQENLSSPDTDSVAVLEDAIRQACNGDDEGAERLVSELGGDLGVLIEFFVRYAQGTEAGEA